MKTSLLKPNFQVVNRKNPLAQSPSVQPPPAQTYPIQAPQELARQQELEHPFAIDFLKEFIGDILVFTEQEQLLYASNGAREVLRRLQQNNTVDNKIPKEILHICQSLIQSRHCFPHQNWLIEFDIFTQDATALHIRARWLKLEQLDRPCLLLIIEDRQQAIVNIVIEEAKQYGLTPREKEVWMLHRKNLTYKQIAIELGITPNTVKKHMRSIHAKKRGYQD